MMYLDILEDLMMDKHIYQKFLEKNVTLEDIKKLRQELQEVIVEMEKTEMFKKILTDPWIKFMISRITEIVLEILKNL